MISQLFALSVFVNFDKNLSVFEIFYSILTFFLAPYLFIATKRLIGLNIKELLDK